jgi:hypothetical protein
VAVTVVIADVLGAELPMFDQYQLVSEVLPPTEAESVTGPIKPLGLNPVDDVPVTA